MYEKHIFVCNNSRDESDKRGCCHSRGSDKFLKKLKELCKEGGLKGRVRVNSSGCLDYCASGPVVVVYPEGVWYKGVTEEDADAIYSQHIIGGKPVDRLLMIKAKSV
jgi:(2Fe-2S) ferredoxin